MLQAASLSWVSQLVSVSVRTRSGLSAAKIWQIPPPLSFSDQIDLIYVQRVEHVLQHLRVGGHRTRPERLRFPCRRVQAGRPQCSAEKSEKRAELVAPHVLVQQHAVDEESDWSRPNLRVADSA